MEKIIIQRHILTEKINSKNNWFVKCLYNQIELLNKRKNLALTIISDYKTFFIICFKTEKSILLICYVFLKYNSNPDVVPGIVALPFKKYDYNFRFIETKDINKIYHGYYNVTNLEGNINVNKLNKHIIGMSNAMIRFCKRQWRD